MGVGSRGSSGNACSCFSPPSSLGSCSLRFTLGLGTSQSCSAADGGKAWRTNGSLTLSYRAALEQARYPYSSGYRNATISISALLSRVEVRKFTFCPLITIPYKLSRLIISACLQGCSVNTKISACGSFGRHSATSGLPNKSRSSSSAASALRTPVFIRSIRSCLVAVLHGTVP
jgi:hypothetical protein